MPTTEFSSSLDTPCGALWLTFELKWYAAEPSGQWDAPEARLVQAEPMQSRRPSRKTSSLWSPATLRFIEKRYSTPIEELISWAPMPPAIGTFRRQRGDEG